MNKLQELLYNYTNNYQTADKMFVIRTIDIILSENRKLAKYLNKVEFTNYGVRFDNFYNGRPTTDVNEKDMSLNIDINSIIDYNNDTYSGVINELNLKEKVFQINLSVIETILHQLENLLQLINKQKGIKNLESELVNISKYKTLEEQDRPDYVIDSYIQYMHLFDNEYYQNGTFYNLNPAQRMANIKSSKIVSSIADEMLNDNSKLLKDLFKYRYLEKKLYGYYPSLYSPLRTYLEYKASLADQCDLYIRDKEERNLLKNNSQLSLDEKMLYGMPLTYNEMDQEYNKLYNTESHQLLKK